MENLRITMPDNVSVAYRLFQASSLSVSDAVQQQNIASDTVDISSVANMIKEAAEALSAATAPEPVQESVDGIDAEYINTIIELGRAVPKGDETIDDLSWGLTVKLGIEMGIDDADVLRELKVSDVDTYFYEAVHKKAGFEAGMTRFDGNGNAVSYDDPADIWKDMFVTDADGNFVKDSSGKAVRNEDFTQYRAQTQGTGVTGYSTDAPTWDFSDYSGRLTDAPAGLIQNILLGVDNDDPFMYRYSREHATDRMPVWSSKTTEGMGEKEKISFYVKQLSDSYNLLKSSMANAPTVQAQMEELKNMYKGAEWKSVRAGGGISDFLALSR